MSENVKRNIPSPYYSYGSQRLNEGTYDDTYTRSYQYDAIGNILNKSDQGIYAYSGHVGGSFANPHAVTSAGGVVLSYDRSGNLTSNGEWSHKYDYANRLAWSARGPEVVTYGYDHAGSRVRKASILSGERVYPNQFYTITGNATQVHIFADGERIATFSAPTSSGGGTFAYHHTDHLGSTAVNTDEAGTVVQVLDYYPYGSLRIDQTTSFDSSRKFTGHEFDRESDLTYANARYYDQDIGRWLSQDPAFINTDRLAIQLKDPQSWNSYSYARNNPLVLSDPTGEFWWVGFYDWSGYEGAKGVMMKAGEVLGGRNRALNAIRNNQDSISAASNKYGVNSALTNAIIYEEQSHLTPDEVLGREQLFPNVGKGGVGLMQVSGPIGEEFGNYSKAELARDPNKNIDAGTAYLGSIGSRLNTNNPSTIGATYNGASAYGQRIQAQINNPNYNKNAVVHGLQQVVKSLKSLVKNLKDRE